MPIRKENLRLLLSDWMRIKNKGDYVRQDFQLKEIPDGAKEAKCDLKITKDGGLYC